MKAVSWQERAATLAEARQLAHAGERGAALQLLLALWRSAPGVVPAELGDAIARLGEELRLRTEKLGGNAAVRQRAWLKRGKAVRSKKGASDGEVELLLDDLSQGSLVSAKARLAMVVGWPADPRIDRTVLRLLREVPYPSASSRPFWRSLLERATKLRDARALAELPTALDALLRGVTLELATFAREQRKQLEDALAARGLPTSELTSTECEALATIGKATASREMLTAQADELLAAIQADPLDNAARRVYADVLNELGDPRGSFIELSFRQSEGTLDKTQERTLKRLLKTHGRDWLGALDKVVAHSDIAFERGFLAACRMRKLSQQAAEKLAGHPLFSTVERFEGPAPIYLHPVMRALREVVADADGAEALLGDEDPRPHIDTLIYVGPRATSGTALRYQRVSDWPPVELEADEIALLRECQGLPGLRHLRFRNADLQPWVPGFGIAPSGWAWLFDAPVLARLERLTLPSAFFYVGPWLDKLATIDLCERLHFELDLGSLREDHAFEQLHVRWTGQPPSAAQRASIEAEIQRLGPKAHFEAPSS